MIQRLETTLKAGAVPQAPQFKPTVAPATPAATSVNRSVDGNTVQSKQVNHKDNSAAYGEQEMSKDDTVASADKASCGQEKPSANSSKGDLLGDARSKVQEEIGKEFEAIMASGTFRASEAAAMATRKVMLKYGYANAAQS